MTTRTHEEAFGSTPVPHQYLNLPPRCEHPNLMYYYHLSPGGSQSKVHSEHVVVVERAAKERETREGIWNYEAPRFWIPNPYFEKPFTRGSLNSQEDLVKERELARLLTCDIRRMDEEAAAAAKEKQRVQEISGFGNVDLAELDGLFGEQGLSMFGKGQGTIDLFKDDDEPPTKVPKIAANATAHAQGAVSPAATPQNSSRAGTPVVTVPRPNTPAQKLPGTPVANGSFAKPPSRPPSTLTVPGVGNRASSQEPGAPGTVSISGTPISRPASAQSSLFGDNDEELLQQITSRGVPASQTQQQMAQQQMAQQYKLALPSNPSPQAQYPPRPHVGTPIHRSSTPVQAQQGNLIQNQPPQTFPNNQSFPRSDYPIVAPALQNPRHTKDMQTFIQGMRAGSQPPQSTYPRPQHGPQHTQAQWQQSAVPYDQQQMRQPPASNSHPSAGFPHNSPVTAQHEQKRTPARGIRSFPPKTTLQPAPQPPKSTQTQRQPMSHEIAEQQSNIAAQHARIQHMQNMQRMQTLQNMNPQNTNLQKGNAQVINSQNVNGQAMNASKQNVNTQQPGTRPQSAQHTPPQSQNNVQSLQTSVATPARPQYQEPAFLRWYGSLAPEVQQWIRSLDSSTQQALASIPPDQRIMIMRQFLQQSNASLILQNAGTSQQRAPAQQTPGQQQSPPIYDHQQPQVPKQTFTSPLPGLPHQTYYPQQPQGQQHRRSTASVNTPSGQIQYGTSTRTSTSDDLKTKQAQEELKRKEADLLFARKEVDVARVRATSSPKSNASSGGQPSPAHQRPVAHPTQPQLAAVQRPHTPLAQSNQDQSMSTPNGSGSSGRISQNGSFRTPTRQHPSPHGQGTPDRSGTGAVVWTPKNAKMVLELQTQVGSPASRLWARGMLDQLERGNIDPVIQALRQKQQMNALQAQLTHQRSGSQTISPPERQQRTERGGSQTLSPEERHQRMESAARSLQAELLSSSPSQHSQSGPRDSPKKPQAAASPARMMEQRQPQASPVGTRPPQNASNNSMPHAQTSGAQNTDADFESSFDTGDIPLDPELEQMLQEAGDEVFGRNNQSFGDSPSVTNGGSNTATSSQRAPSFASPQQSQPPATPSRSRKASGAPLTLGRKVNTCPIPSDIMQAVMDIMSLPKNNKGVPARTEMAKHDQIAPYFNKGGYLRASSELAEWVGDTRLFSVDQWMWLTKGNVDANFNGV